MKVRLKINQDDPYEVTLHLGLAAGFRALAGRIMWPALWTFFGMSLYRAYVHLFVF